MSNTKFTRGPWTVQHVGGQGTYRIPQCAAGERAAEFEGSDVDRANAALISAAPNLYEALSGLVQQLQEAGLASDFRLDFALAALERAEGIIVISDGAE